MTPPRGNAVAYESNAALTLAPAETPTFTNRRRLDARSRRNAALFESDADATISASALAETYVA
jgi:hypothetical protein